MGGEWSEWNETSKFIFYTKDHLKTGKSKNTI